MGVPDTVMDVVIFHCPDAVTETESPRGIPGALTVTVADRPDMLTEMLLLWPETARPPKLLLTPRLPVAPPVAALNVQVSEAE